MKKHVFLVACVALFLMVATPVLAQTPDGETPANEGVCDELMADGVTKGLYGLCVAFCEAQDCEATLDEATGEITFHPDCRSSNPKLLNNYNNRKTENDPPIPCVNVIPNVTTCPCWTEAEVDAIPSLGWCQIESFSAKMDSPIGSYPYYFAWTKTTQCGFSVEGGTGGNLRRLLDLDSEAEFFACRDSIYNRCCPGTWPGCN